MSNCLIYNIIEDRERIEIPFPLILEMVYAFPSAVNPIFPVHKKANPSSHFTPSGPSIDNIRKWGLISEIKH